MTHDEIVREMATAAGIPVRRARAAEKRLREIIGRELAAGNSVHLPSVGTLHVIDLDSRFVQIPGNDAPTFVPPRKAARFRPAEALQNAIRQGDKR